MLGLFLSAFVTFFVVIDPPGCAPIFASLTRGGSVAHRRAMALRSTGIATAILILFALVGEPLLTSLGISLDAFRIAGGIMVFLIALEMVFEKRTERREERAEEINRRLAETHKEEPEDISVFPMGIPMIAGPGSIATAMLVTSHNHGTHLLVVLAALAAVLITTLVSLLAAGAIMRVLGDKLEAMITRILGVLLAALAAQYVIDGVKASFELNTMVLELRPNCEYCDKDLPPDAADARICTYECTFCADCVETKLSNVCPNCGGGFSARPIRPATEWRPGLSVAKRPPSTQRRSLSYELAEIEALSRKLRDIPPEQR